MKSTFSDLNHVGLWGLVSPGSVFWPHSSTLLAYAFILLWFLLKEKQGMGDRVGEMEIEKESVSSTHGSSSFSENELSDTMRKPS